MKLFPIGITLACSPSTIRRQKAFFDLVAGKIKLSLCEYVDVVASLIFFASPSCRIFPISEKKIRVLEIQLYSAFLIGRSSKLLSFFQKIRINQLYFLFRNRNIFCETQTYSLPCFELYFKEKYRLQN